MSEYKLIQITYFCDAEVYQREFNIKIKMMVLSEFREPDSVIRHQQVATKAVIDKQELGVGTLYITERLMSL